MGQVYSEPAPPLPPTDILPGHASYGLWAYFTFSSIHTKGPQPFLFRAAVRLNPDPAFSAFVLRPATRRGENQLQLTDFLWYYGALKPRPGSYLYVSRFDKWRTSGRQRTFET
jgi:hypothetical protein